MPSPIPPDIGPILWPTLTLAALIFGVLFLLMRQRLAHIARTRPERADFATREAQSRYFAPVARPADNLANLFEMPVLYFSLVPLLIQQGEGHGIEVLLAWAYVGLRLCHTVLHIRGNAIRNRFRAFVASNIVLLAMWVWFAFTAWEKTNG